MLDQAAAGVTAALPPAERARARAIALGVLRHLGPIDDVLAPHLRKPPPMRARQILRIAAWELLVDGVPDHAAVDGAVIAAKASRKVAHLAGMINAVARKLPGTTLAGPQPLPDYLRKPLMGAYGAPAVTEMERVFAGEPPLDLTIKQAAKADDWAKELGGTLLPTGTVRLTRPGQVSILPGFETGDWWVQDAAAALPVAMLGDVEGLRVLDLCAAPGGKTMQLAAKGARVTAVDVSDERLERLSDNLERTGLNAEVVCADAFAYDQTGFDVVLLDAPCSASGTIRRHPDMPFLKKTLDLTPLLEVQRRMIAHAATLLAPQGKLLFCTCSLLPAEGEAHMRKLLKKGWHSVGNLPAGCAPEWLSDKGFLRLRPDFWPERGGMDGFFAAVLSRD